MAHAALTNKKRYHKPIIVTPNLSAQRDTHSTQTPPDGSEPMDPKRSKGSHKTKGDSKVVPPESYRFSPLPAPGGQIQLGCGRRCGVVVAAPVWELANRDSIPGSRTWD